MIWSILEGLGLGVLLFIYCLIGIRNGAIGMVHLYGEDVQKRCVELGLTTTEKINKRGKTFRIVGMVSYIAYALIFVYLVNKATKFIDAFLQILIIFMICNVIDRIFVDEIWVGHTKTWIIPGTEDLMPYIKTKDKIKKWIVGTFGMAIISLILAGIMSLIIK